MMDSGLLAGALIDGKYKVLGLIGSGGMGSVYEAEHVRIRRRVAIKVLHAPVARDPKLVKRFEREAQAVARIGSRHVTDVLDFGELATGDHYMVMEYLEGETLANRLAEEGTLPPEEAVAIVVQILEGLATMHDAGIIHRDLKPANIFLTRGPSGAFVKILDFGICKFSAPHDAQWTTAGSTVLGTPGYLSPEQLSTDDTSSSVDLYAIGVVLYRSLVGRLPYDATNRAELLIQIRDGLRVPIEDAAPGIDKALAAIVTKSIASDKAARFQTAADFRNALLAWTSSAASPERAQPARSPLKNAAASDTHEPTLAEVAPPAIDENGESTMRIEPPLPEPRGAGGADLRTTAISQARRAAARRPPSPLKAIVVGAIVGVAGVVLLYAAFGR